MSKFGLMVDRCINPESIPVLVDLGSVDEKVSRDRADALMASGVGRGNLSIEGFRRLLVKLPAKKVQDILASFPIVAGSTYWQTTHHWRGLADGEKIGRIPLSTLHSPRTPARAMGRVKHQF